MWPKTRPGIRASFGHHNQYFILVFPAAAVILYWALNLFSIGPNYGFHDGLAYLSKAALLSGHQLDAASSWHAGYPLFLAPLFALFESPELIWELIKVLHACLWGISLMLGWKLLHFLFPKSTKRNIQLSLILLALYPSWIAITGFAFTTSFFVFVFMLSFFSLTRVDPKKPLSIIPFSIITAFLFWVHPIGLAPAAASVLLFSLRKNKKAWFLVLHIGIVAALLLLHNKGIQVWLNDYATPEQFRQFSHYPQISQFFDKLLTPSYWLRSLLILGGQTSYLIIASLGLIVPGFALFLRKSRDWFQGGRKASDWKEQLCMYAGFSLAAALLVGSLTFSFYDHTRIDQLVYGRYTEHIVFPMLLFSLPVFLKEKYKQLARQLLGGAVTVIVSGTLLNLAIVYGDLFQFFASNVKFNTIALWPQYLALNSRYLLWFNLGAIPLIVNALPAFVTTREKKSRYRNRPLTRMHIAFFGLLFLTASIFSLVNSTRYHQRFIKPDYYAKSIREIITSNFPKGELLAIDPHSISGNLFHSAFNTLLFYLHNYNIRRMHFNDWKKDPEGPFLSKKHYLAPSNRDNRGQEEPGAGTRVNKSGRGKRWDLIGQDKDTAIFLYGPANTVPASSLAETENFSPAHNGRIRSSICIMSNALQTVPRRTGRFAGGELVSTGQKGHLCYGPYTPVHPGQYRLEIFGTISPEGKAVIDLHSNTYKKETIFKRRLQHKKGTKLLRTNIRLQKYYPDLEVRLWVGQKGSVRLAGYKLTFLEPLPQPLPQ